MSSDAIDKIDQQILYLLQQDARNYTNSEISEEIGVAPSTVGSHIAALEAKGIIKGYYPLIDYDLAEYPLHFLFICTAEIIERGDLIQEVSELSGVVNIQELMTGEENIHIEVVGSRHDDITELATAINELGVHINEEILIKNKYPQPASVFGNGE